MEEQSDKTKQIKINISTHGLSQGQKHKQGDAPTPWKSVQDSHKIYLMAKINAMLDGQTIGEQKGDNQTN